MSFFQVTPEELAAAGGAVGRCSSDVDDAQAAVAATAGAAAGTPAAGACEALVADAGRTLESLRVSVEDLGRALNLASGNYARTEQSIRACYAPGAGP
jgi:Excreted virulence factor EspC, type VII ESX diderm